VSEAGIVGLAGGMALRGWKPIVEIMFGDFVMLAADQITNHLTKFRTMYGGLRPVHVVVRTPMGGGRAYGPTHSQSLEKHLLGIPSLEVIAPSRFHDPGALLAQAVEEGQPVLFVEEKRLYPSALVTTVEPPLELRVEGARWPTAILSTGDACDVCVFTYGSGSLEIETFVRGLAEDEVDVTVVMPSRLSSFDVPHLASIARRARAGVVVVEEGTAGFNWGSELVALLAEALGPSLPPIRRLAALPTILPASRELEARVLPGLDRVRATILELCARSLETRP
jgi:pyruvate/2-oxoglutarate/acetoin dehydrogenase E1 component